MFDHEIRIEMARERAAQLQRAWYPSATPVRYTFGSWLIRLGRRLSAEPPRRRSAFAHEALPRC
jgi:hypothetical protein